MYGAVWCCKSSADASLQFAVSSGLLRVPMEGGRASLSHGYDFLLLWLNTLALIPMLPESTLAVPVLAVAGNALGCEASVLSSSKVIEGSDHCFGFPPAKFLHIAVFSAFLCASMHGYTMNYSVATSMAEPQ